MKCDYPNCEAGSAGTYCRASCVQLTKDRAAAWIHTDPDKPRVKFLEWREDEPGYRGRWGKTPLYTAPPRCPNCASLEDQNTELDRKLAEMERKLFELQAAVFRSQGIRCSDVGT